MLIYGTKLVASIAKLWDHEPQTTSDNCQRSNHVQSCLIYIPIRKHPNRPMQRSNLQRCFFVRQCLFPFYCLRLWFHCFTSAALRKSPIFQVEATILAGWKCYHFFLKVKVATCSEHIGIGHIYISVGHLRKFFPRRTPVQRVCLLAWWRETLGWKFRAARILEDFWDKIW